MKLTKLFELAAAIFFAIYEVVYIYFTRVSLEAGYWWSTTAYVASHRQLLNLTFKRVVVVISSTEMGRDNYESLY